MQQIPMICDGDWWELWFVPAENEEAALTQEANRIVSERNEDGELVARINPAGVQGNHTPNKNITIQMLCNGEWHDETTLITPVYEPNLCGQG